MRRDLRSAKFGHVGGCASDGATDDMSRTESSESFTSGTDEDRCSITRLKAPFFAQLLECSCQIGRQRQHPFFSTFPAEQDVRRSTQTQVSGIDPARLGHAGTGASQKQEKR